MMLVKLKGTSPFITEISLGPHPLPWEKNSLPRSIQNAESLSCFKLLINTYNF